MTQRNTWVDGLELAAHLNIRPSRAAQILRAGLMPFQTSAGGPLIHQKDIARFATNFPELLDYFRAEKEVDNHVEDGELIFEQLSFPSAPTVKLLRCVERHEGSFPERAPHPR